MFLVPTNITFKL